MKIIKSITAIIICLGATALLHAQEVKPEIEKKMEVKVPAAANSTSMPGLKSPTLEAPPAAQAPSPLTRKEDAKPEEKDKLEAKVITPTAIATPGGEEGRKTLAGKAEDQKPSGPTTPNTIDQNPKVLLPAKSTATKQEQNK